MAQIFLLSTTPLLVNISIWVCYEVYIVFKAGEKEVQLWRLLTNMYKYDMVHVIFVGIILLPKVPYLSQFWSNEEMVYCIGVSVKM
jgi:hypothetical protein